MGRNMGFFFKKKKDKAEENLQEQVPQTPVTEDKTGKGQTEEEPECVRTWINQEAGTEFCGGDRDTYLEILQDYCEEGKNYQEKLAQCLEAQDWKSFAIHVHAVKSTSKTIGSEDFGEEARVLEFAAKEENADLIRANWQEFCVHYKQILAEAEQIIGE